MSRTLLALALTLVFSTAQARADSPRDISKVNGGITAEPGEAYGDLETVNGGIQVHEGVVAQDVQTVNGGIRLGDQAQVQSATTVNGGIKAGQGVRVRDDAETVNGGIRFDFHSSIGGDVSTVNGGITLRQSEVGGEVSTVGGDIIIGARSVVRGGLIVHKQNRMGISWGKPRIPRVVIGPNAVVEGPLRFDREVELYVAPSARTGPISGAVAKPFSGELPPRD